MQITYHGHSVVKIVTNGKTILIDPFITGNELCDLQVAQEKPDYILITHGHNDHVGDTVQLAKQSGATVVGSHELATWLGAQGLTTHGMNIGGAKDFDFGKVTYTQAFHSSSYITENNDIIYMGMPMGIVLEIEGVTIYHAGDTALFSDMKLIANKHAIDVAFLPIGDNFTMGIEDAALAVKWLQPKTVVPIHFNTFPPIQQNPQQFADLVQDANVQIVQPGGTVTF
ncbi:MAG TPA: metal-dependent hydrolase [Metalysinibacillus jejuensis]|uniref:UPF0173 metal-dependent hydrolase K8V30_02620 n=1 Tax=Metalysinibacillus jejuensis TaxID=914327 RepID=A0A921NBE8_9BACL|nr:metal-dependent hydrolase [Metalysinibacillus jejuensis]HJH10583.1 metal-dependent hydrolase [Metalysinibacillus jejuensis]